VPLSNIGRGPIEPTVPQLELWAMADNGASDACNMYEANDTWVQHWLNLRVNTCLRMIWLRRVGILLNYKIAYSKDSECTELLGWFHLQMLCIPDTLSIHATKREVNEYNYRLDTMCITEIGESQAMIMMFKDIYNNNLENVCTDIDRKHIYPEF
jgi:hypothetical protein